MEKVGSHQAKTNLSKLLDKVAQGQRITITKHGVPVAVLVPACAQEKGNPKEVILEIRALRYGDFRRQGLFVGSGVVEAGCKTLVGQRLKQSGMEWSLRGANAIISLRCMMKSGRFEEYWEARAG